MLSSESSNRFNRGFPTNRIPVVLPSTGKTILLRETTVVELKSMCKIIIDNLNRKQMDVIYDAVSDYLQSMILSDEMDVDDLTEYDRLFCLMVFFQMSFYKDSITTKCPACNVDLVYRYDLSKYLSKMYESYVDDQEVEIEHKNKVFKVTVGWPKVKEMRKLMLYFYGSMDEITEEMERTQYGIDFIMTFIKKVTVIDPISQNVEATIDLSELSTWEERLDCINSLPSVVVFDQDFGLFSKITGFFINRLENCFGFDLCPQCHKETYNGLGQSAHFYQLFYGSLKSLYRYLLQVECLLIFRYGVSIFNDEQHMTYNDLNTLVNQISTTAEKENDERKKVGHEPLYKGLWYIREILNLMIFPQDNIKR